MFSRGIKKGFLTFLRGIKKTSGMKWVKQKLLDKKLYVKIKEKETQERGK